VPTVNVAETELQMSELLDMVERGQDVVITRAGRPAARVTRLEPMAERKPIDFARIDALRESTPMQAEPAGKFMRRVRDEERY
jgi:prevent-host-death family protein